VVRVSTGFTEEQSKADASMHGCMIVRQLQAKYDLADWRVPMQRGLAIFPSSSRL